MVNRLFALVVDDLRTLRFPPEYEVVHARTVEHGAVELVRNHTHILILDHDLGRDEVKRLVTFIQMRFHTGKPLLIDAIYIVSSNPQAHTEFPPALRSCGYTVGVGLGPAWIDPDETAFWSEITASLEWACKPYG